MDELLSDFLTEASESLAELDTALLTLERTPEDHETLSLIFRLVHTIKGTCGFLGLPRLEAAAHAAENVLGKLRDRTLSVTPEIISLILTALDRIKAIVTGLAENGTEPPGDDAPLIAALDAAAGEVASPAQATKNRPAQSNGINEAPRTNTADSPVSGALAETAAGTATTQTIRVHVEVLEDLMTLVSELVLTRNQLMQLVRSEENSAFTVPLQRLSHITSDLQEGVMKTRMQPIGNAWNKLPRLVRDLSHDLGKKIELAMLGADTELDRQVLELIKDPLTHMVRNAGDHGLETPAERQAAGKPETGRITLNAFHEGGHIIIEVGDDGRGLPLARIKAKALANGLIAEADLASISDSQLQTLIFHPGFSTASQVTSVSGRGVGMDVVKTNIEKIGGTIALRSSAGGGTSFIIKIPLTLAIVSALIVEAGGERFAIPQLSVLELVQARNQGADGTEPLIELVNETPVLRLRDRLLPLVSLTGILGLEAKSAQEATVTVVVTQVGPETLGIIVDQVFDTEEIVVKPVAPILRHVTMFSGNTILGDGSVIMILDPNGIARTIGIGSETDARPGNQCITETFGSQEKTALLLFRAGQQQRMAVPLNLVARLEQVQADKIETSCGSPVIRYRGRLMPLIPLGGSIDAQRPCHPVLVFTDQGRCMGLVVDEIVDIVEDRLNVELSHSRPGLLGTALISGHATDVIDTGHWLQQAWNDWFQTPDAAGKTSEHRILVVEDSNFFRQLLIPTLRAAGFAITAVASAADALRIRDSGAMFDAILSDIEMPDMDGLAFARCVRQGGAWAALPMIALSARTKPHDVQAGHSAGFTDYVAKFDRDRLLSSLRDCLNGPQRETGMQHAG
jgi:two-component system chemotaxis sensor kinase CheA